MVLAGHVRTAGERHLSSVGPLRCRRDSQGHTSSPERETRARPGRPPGSRPSIRSARPAGSLLGSCRIGAGLSSQTAALRPPSSSRRSAASRTRRRTSEEPRQTPRSGYRPRRTVGLPRRRIRRVGSYCGNLGPPPQYVVAYRAFRVGQLCGFRGPAKRSANPSKASANSSRRMNRRLDIQRRARVEHGLMGSIDSSSDNWTAQPDLSPQPNGPACKRPLQGRRFLIVGTWRGIERYLRA